jgi:hypothetical protein
MGASPYFYFVKYQADREKALQELRQQEFQAGRYNPAVSFPDFPIRPSSPSPGAQHESIEDALEDSDADGTRSILDLDHFSDEPEFCAVTPLSQDVLKELYGTTQPTRAMIEKNMDFLDDIERGHGVSIVAYKNGQPDEFFFAGYSFD